MGTTIETRVAQVEYGEDGILRYKFSPGAEIEVEDVIELSQVRMQLTGDGAVPIYINGIGARSITREARKQGAAPPGFPDALAVGVLTSPLSRAMANLLQGLNKPRYPLRLFITEDAAIEWLKEFVKQHPDS